MFYHVLGSHQINCLVGTQEFPPGAVTATFPEARYAEVTSNLISRDISLEPCSASQIDGD
jgi:hypothetical protein